MTLKKPETHRVRGFLKVLAAQRYQKGVYTMVKERAFGSATDVVTIQNGRAGSTPGVVDLSKSPRPLMGDDFTIALEVKVAGSKSPLRGGFWVFLGSSCKGFSGN